jgi:hypothetical protein
MKWLISALLSLSFMPAPKPVIEKWIVGQKSNICIEGKTNINNFRCDIYEYLPQDTLLIVRDDAEQKPLTIKGGISIDINRFDCHQKYITSDLRKTLKADKSPCLSIQLVSIGYFSQNKPPANVKGWVVISLAGVNKQLDINYVVTNAGPEGMQFTGTRTIRFADFGLTPPRKLAGMIRVEEEINVKFQLWLHEINQ